jgi:hypothetical protein
MAADMMRGGLARWSKEEESLEVEESGQLCSSANKVVDKEY